MKAIKIGFLALTVSMSVLASNGPIEVSCQSVYLEEAALSVHKDKLLSFERISCEKNQSARGEILTLPSMMMRKYKIDGNGRVGTIQTVNGKQDIQYLDAQKTIVESEYHIPDCGDVGQKWRMQLGAIADSGRVANEEFFHLIRSVVNSCGIQHRDMENIRFCKTNGEAFGHEEQEGHNATTRLFAVLDDKEPMISEPAARAILHHSCQKKIEKDACENSLHENCQERGLYGKLVNCMPRVQVELSKNLLLNEKSSSMRHVWIVPPKDILNENFTVKSNKYQFMTCQSLAVTPALETK